ncbi:MAG: hypothetical protein OQK75_12535 [Gammaproteobacteria bacterium]|nr:hypothetical protein [Gammaproteobacteria bacterium]MCW8988485.1 hypothetical protein [Gammaproteobacteria bacterium]MCW9031780.1 hypothetical protein [Gammaproteobacteria bacterium]
MTTFKITNDDIGVRGLQEANKTPVITGPVRPVKASNPVQKSPEHIPLNANQSERKHYESLGPHRRKSDRRKTNTPVLLDTRSVHDRRTKTQKSDDESNDAITTLHGIDETV